MRSPTIEPHVPPSNRTWMSGDQTQRVMVLFQTRHDHLIGPGRLLEDKWVLEELDTSNKRKPVWQLQHIFSFGWRDAPA